MMRLVTDAQGLGHIDGGLSGSCWTLANPNGGAVAIGHPLGAIGTQFLLTATREPRRRCGRWVAAAICSGLGQTDTLPGAG